MPQPETVFEGVHSLPAGSWLDYDGRTVRVAPYWRLPYADKLDLPYAEAMRRTRELVADSVRLRLRSDVPLGVFLSGGVDSTVIAYESARHLGGELRTFTIAVDDPAFDESQVAARSARALGIQNVVLRLEPSPLDELQRLVRQYDQPFADPSAIPSLAVCRLARQHVKVVLNGDGGDEVFAGYRRHLAARLSGMLAHLPAFAAHAGASLAELCARGRRSAAGFAARLFRGLTLPTGARYLAWTGDMLLEADKLRVWRGGRMRPTEEWLESVIPQGLSPLDTQLAGDVSVNLLSDLLVKMDIASMAASLEARSPLLDHTLAEFVASLPDGYRIRGGRLKALLRDSYRGCIPDEVLRAAARL